MGEIGEKELRVLLQNRSANVKQRILKRLTTEIKTYALIALFLLCISLIEGFGTFRLFFVGALTLLLVVPSIAVLAYKEYRLQTLSVSGTLRESILILMKAIDSTARAYLFAYFATVVVSLVVIEFILISSKGLSLVTMISVVVALLIAGWSYLSGRRYAAAMFRKHRSELDGILSELESQAS